MQSPRNQEIEVRDEGAEAREMLDTPDQCLVRRIVLIDNRRTVLSAIVDNDIDLIAAKPRIVDCPFQPGRQFRTRLWRRWAEEVVDVFLDVLVDAVEVFADSG